MPELNFQFANPTQREFIFNTFTESVFDGGIGNGKTTGGLMRLLYLAVAYPGSRWVVARQEWKILKNTTYKTFHAKVCPKELIASNTGEVSGNDPKTILTNGSEIIWMHLDVMDTKGLTSLEINGSFVDQMEEIKPEIYEVLESRAGRWQMAEWPRPCPRYTWGASNPAGHDWIYYRFHPECSPPDNRGYFFATTLDNLEMLRKIQPAYVDDLLKKPESWKAKWVYGNREIFEGQVHRGFSRKLHVYDHKAFNPLKTRDITGLYAYFDYGLSSPTALLVVARDKEGFRWVVSEYYIPNRKINEHAEELKKLTGSFPQRVEWVKADPSVFYTEMRDREGPQSIALDYAQYGFYFIKADNNEDTSIERVNQLLHYDEQLLNPITRERGSPKLFISDTCINLIEELPNQRWKLKRNVLTGENEFVEERDPNIPDHAYDCLRYMANDYLDYKPYTGTMKRLSVSYAHAV